MPDNVKCKSCPITYDCNREPLWAYKPTKWNKKREPIEHTKVRLCPLLVIYGNLLAKTKLAGRHVKMAKPKSPNGS